jgi:hypothetical protein
MTLAQNHQLPLNGNNRNPLALRVFLLFFLLWFNIIGLIASPKPTSKDSGFKIAMILPLHLHEYNGNNVNRANIMLDYYQGFYLALKEYENQGLHLKVFLYDNEHDTNKTKEILLKPELKKVDLIITPILDEHLHILNHFSCKYQIPVFSPFTAVDSLFPNNPLFFNSAPAKKTKAEVFYNYYRKTNPNKIVLIIRNEADWKKGYGNELLSLLESKKDIDYRIISTEDLLKADSNFLPKGKEYLIYHHYASEDAKGLKNLSNFLDKQKGFFEILGDYKPSTLKNISENKRKKFNIKIVTSDYINPLDSAFILRDFKVNYRFISNLNPSRYSLIGHDQACFISEILLKYDRFKANDFTGETYEYFATRYKFKKDDHCNQNKGIYILKINELGNMEEVKY